MRARGRRLVAAEAIALTAGVDTDNYASRSTSIQTPTMNVEAR